MAQVLICSKLPHSFWLEIVKPPADPKATWPTPVDPDSPRVEIRGANSLRVTEDQPSVSEYRYAQTPVDEALWRKWLETNSGLAFIRNGMVFEAKSLSEAQGKAKERVSDLRTGVEPLAQENDSRLQPVAGAPKFAPAQGVAV